MKKILAILLLVCLVSTVYAELLHKPGEVIVKFRVELRNDLDFNIESDFVECGIPTIDNIFQTFSIKDYQQLIPDYDNTRNIDYALDMIYVFYCETDNQGVASVAEFEKNSFVEYSELNYQMEAFGKVDYNPWKPFFTPNDYYYSYQWFLPQINAEAAWDIQTGSHAKVVAIIDDAVERNHEDLSGNYMTGYDFYDNDGDPTPTDPNYSHGTHCSGCAAAVTNNSIGVASIGYNIGLIGVRTRFYNTALTQGINWSAQNGADVMSLSWGGSGPVQSIEDAINDATNNYDILIFAAAGNDNTSTPMYPAYYGNTVAVAASNPSDTKADFSNYGSWVDITAPGTDIASCIPYGLYDYKSGTSMACPVTAGLATLMRCQFPSETNVQIVQRLYNSADPMTGCSYYNAGQMGYGRINALAALSGGGGGGDTTELIYDDGSPESHYYWGDGVIVGSRMTTPSSKGFYKLIGVKIHLGNTNSGSNTFYLKVFNWSGSQPGSEILSGTATGTDNQWNTWDVSSNNITFNSNTDFLVGMEFFGGNLPTWGYDASNNGRAWDYDGSWSSWTETYFMRAIVVDLSTGIEEEIGNDIEIDKIDLSISNSIISSNATITYAIQNSGFVALKIYDLSGREVRTLVNRFENPGLRHVNFDRTDNNGIILPAGTYICNLRTEWDNINQRLIIIE